MCSLCGIVSNQHSSWDIVLSHWMDGPCQGFLAREGIPSEWIWVMKAINFDSCPLMSICRWFYISEWAFSWQHSQSLMAGLGNLSTEAWGYRRGGKLKLDLLWGGAGTVDYPGCRGQVKFHFERKNPIAEYRSWTVHEIQYLIQKNALVYKWTFILYS